MTNNCFLATILFLLMMMVSSIRADEIAHEKETTNSAEANTLGTKSNEEIADGNLATFIRDAIYKDRKLLLSYLNDPRAHPIICTPALRETYELFQESLRDELDVLWDLDIYWKKYGLSKKERESVNACSAYMEKYLDNFEAWERLIRETERQ